MIFANIDIGEIRTLSVSSVPSLFIFVVVRFCGEHISRKGIRLIEVDYGRLGVERSYTSVVIATRAFTHILNAVNEGSRSNSDETEDCVESPHDDCKGTDVLNCKVTLTTI